MRKLKVLCWDDDQGDLDLVKGVIETAWREVEEVIEIEVYGDTSYEIVEERLSSGEWQLLATDILAEGSTESPRGLNLIRQATKVSSRHRTAILAFSREIKDFRRQALEAGAQYAFSKPGLISEKDPTIVELGEAIRSALKAYEHELVMYEQAILKYDKTNLQLMAIVTGIGEDTLARLVSLAVEGPCESITIDYVAPGFSGAVPLRVQCQYSSSPSLLPSVQKFLLKVDRDGERLRQEVAGSIHARRFPEGLFVPLRQLPGGRTIVDSGGWHAIAYGLREEVQSLSSWLSGSSANPQSINEIVQSIVETPGLLDVYSISQIRDYSVSRAFDEVFSVSRRARVEIAIDTFGDLCTRHCSEYGHYINAWIKPFVKSFRIGDIDRDQHPHGFSFCLTHGDLHARNILVDSRNRAVIIDPADLSERPSCSDLSRLMVDLFLAGIAEKSDRYEWDNLGCWCSSLQAQINGIHSSDGLRNGPLQAAGHVYRLMVTQLVNADHGPSTVEAHLSLSVELLRTAYRPNQPAPLSCLGLLGGGIVLEHCHQLLGSL